MPYTSTSEDDEIDHVSIERAENGWIIHIRRVGGGKEGPYVYESHKKYSDAMEKIIRRQAVRSGEDGSKTVG
jgi:hypothetical protein